MTEELGRMPWARMVAKAEGRPDPMPDIGILEDPRWLRPPEGEPALTQRWATKQANWTIQFAGRYPDGRCVLALNDTGLLIWPDQQLVLARDLRKPKPDGVMVYENPFSTRALLVFPRRNGLSFSTFPGAQEITIDVPTWVAEQIASWIERATKVPPGSMLIADGMHRSRAWKELH